MPVQNVPLGAIVGTIGGGVVGYLIGEHRALEIRFNAQLAMCQVAIEENTRVLRSEGAQRAGIAPSANASRALSSNGATAAPASVRLTKRCPDCADDVLVEARLCRSCRHEFDASTIPVEPIAIAAQPGPEPESPPAVDVFRVPPGDWVVQSSPPAMGAYTLEAVITGWTFSNKLGHQVELGSRGGSLWLQAGYTGALLDTDTYEWATSAQHAGLMLLRTRTHRPIAIRRR